MVGKDTFVPTDWVAKAFVRWRVIESAPTTRSDRALMQQAFERWAGETGRPLCQLSQILALSID